MKRFDIRYRGFWIWRRAEIFDGIRWLRLDKNSTERQIEADRLFARSEEIISRMDAALSPTNQ